MNDRPRVRALVGILLVVATAVGTSAQAPPRLAVDPTLAAAEVRRALEDAAGFLPVAFALEAIDGVPVAVHGRAGSQGAQIVDQDGVPVLLLTERSYFRQGRMIDLGDAAIDTVAHLFEALFELHAQRTSLADPVRRAELEDVAQALYVDLPSTHRLEALIDAQAQYAGHLISIAANVERSSRRGKDICRQIDSPLFRLWQRAGSTVEYLGAVWLNGARRTTEIDLPPERRREVLVGALGGRWSGLPETDLAAPYCDQGSR